MHTGLLNSLLELAHATSQNLRFAHRKDVNVSYGEETITETNLLELRRRHPDIISLRTFPKKKEAKNGADWEWRIIGRARTFGMRVQAKRVQQDDVLKIRHVVNSSGDEQINLLISDAQNNGLMPVYCFYASEDQRQKWQVSSAVVGTSQFEFGCLLANAHKVKAQMPKSLSAIENHCVPWHYLVDPRRFRRLEAIGIFEGSGRLSFLSSEGAIQLPIPETRADLTRGYLDFPTIDELNGAGVGISDREGIIEHSEGHVDTEISAERFRERGISRLVQIDVREFPLDGGGFGGQSDGRLL